jgi:hypothetical protein
MNSQYNTFSYFWNKTKDLDVPAPRTCLFKIDWESFPRLGIDVQEIQEQMEKWDVNCAFLRSDHKAAPRNIEKGSYINEPTETEITNTIESLIVQHSESVWEVGDYFILREQLDLNFCFQGYNHPLCHPEIRYMIDNGEILYKIGEITQNCICEHQYNYTTDILADASPPDSYANEIASEFQDRPYAIDFVLDTTGDWYVLEANLNGVRWDSDRRDFRNMSGHNDAVWRSPSVIHHPALDYVKKSKQNSE